MIVVRISGGLGNQMFQYAFARALQSRGNQVYLHWHPHHSKSEHNGFELDRVFDSALSDKIPLANGSLLNRIRAWQQRKTSKQREINELQFQPDFLQITSGYLDGYWQTEKYFSDIITTLREEFRFKPITGKSNKALLPQIQERPSCSIHVRRGDYVKHPELGGICTPEYYREAIEKLQSQTDEALQYIVFSDDIPYCKKLFAEHNATFCNWNRGANNWMDLELMRACEHHIIANSSFSWWGAWLTKSNGQTLAPKIWSSKFTSQTEICPKEWLLV